MISVIWSEGGELTVEGELPEGKVAVFDREWAPRGRSSAVPVILLDVGDGDAADRGMAALAEIAQAAVAATTGDTVAVTGSGFVAFEARRLLQAQGRLAADGAGLRPAAVIETTGEPALVREATEHVRTMGTVSLAGEPLARPYDLDLYPDVHLRGLRLVGVARPDPGSFTTDTQHSRTGLQNVALGDQLDASARWYCAMAGARPMTAETLPRVSVIVPAKNAEDDLERLFASLREQTAGPDAFEVLVVDDASSDGTAATVRAEPLARLIEVAATVGPYPARNLAAQTARGNLLAFTDADCIASPEWIERGIAAFDAQEVDMIAGAIRIPLGDRPSAVSMLDAARHLDQELYATRGYGATANMWVRRSVFDQVGGFNEKILSGGDWEFGHRSGALGKKLVYAPEARVDHPPRERAREMARKGFRFGIGNSQARLYAEGPLRQSPAVWAHPRSYLPQRSFGGIHRLEASGHRPGRLRVVQLVLAQYLFLTLPMILGSLVGTLREQRAAQRRH